MKEIDLSTQQGRFDIVEGGLKPVDSIPIVGMQEKLDLLWELCDEGWEGLRLLHIAKTDEEFDARMGNIMVIGRQEEKILRIRGV